MRYQPSSVFIALIGAALLLAACSPSDPPATPTSTPTIAASQTAAPTDPDAPTPTTTALTTDRDGCEVAAPPAELGLDPYYSKYCDANGIIIVASQHVDDFAVKEAWYLVMNFFAPLPEARASLVAKGAQLSIYDSSREDLRDIPEHYTLSFDATEFAAGLGGTLDNPVTVTTEQDLLCSWLSTYRITVHELGHMLRDMYLLPERRGFLRAQNGAFANAVTNGLWEGAYAGENADENWAEGVNAYFGTYRDSFGTRYVDDRESLANYDPQLFELIDSVFMGFDWEPNCPSFTLFE